MGEFIGSLVHWLIGYGVGFHWWQVQVGQPIPTRGLVCWFISSLNGRTLYIVLLPDKSGFKTGAPWWGVSRHYRHIAPLERKLTDGET